MSKIISPLTGNLTQYNKERIKRDNEYKQFFDSAMIGDKVCRSILISRYIFSRDEMPYYCIAYIEQFILNVGVEVGNSNSIPSRLFPDNPKRKSDYWRKFFISFFVCRKVVKEGMTVPEAKELACIEYGIDTRAVEKNIKSAIKYQKTNPDMFSVSIEEHIGSGK
jgi:hypothetical protein